MKAILGLILLSVVSGSCKTKKPDTLDSHSPKFENSATQESTLSKWKLKLSNDRGLQQIKDCECPEKEWEAIEAVLNEVDIEKLKMLKAPTDKRLYDAVPHDTLSVIKSDMGFRTTSFDHGYPPKEIE